MINGRSSWWDKTGGGDYICDYYVDNACTGKGYSRKLRVLYNADGPQILLVGVSFDHW